MRSNNVIITVCSKCRRIEVKGKWIDYPPFLSPYVRKTHAFCPACLAAEMEEVESLVFSELAMSGTRGLQSGLRPPRFS